MTTRPINPFSIWRDLWFAYVIKSEGPDEGRFIDAIYDITTPERLLEFVGSYKHSVKIQIFKRPKRERGMPRFTAPPSVHVATYWVDTKQLEIHGNGNLAELLKGMK
jgi:hypothetical protein